MRSKQLVTATTTLLTNIGGLEFRQVFAQPQQLVLATALCENVTSQKTRKSQGNRETTTDQLLREGSVPLQHCVVVVSARLPSHLFCVFCGAEEEMNFANSKFAPTAKRYTGFGGKMEFSESTDGCVGTRMQTVKQ
jgi:hypothetical protein